MSDVRTKFINACRTKRVQVSVHLANGIKLDGLITEMDEHCILFEGRGITQLVHLHAISTIMPVKADTVRNNKISLDEYQG